MLKIAKFGGSSCASGEQFRKVKEIVMEDRDRRFIVVSAPGKRNDKDIKVKTPERRKFWKRLKIVSGTLFPTWICPCPWSRIFKRFTRSFWRERPEIMLLPEGSI